MRPGGSYLCRYIPTTSHELYESLPGSLSPGKAGQARTRVVMWSAGVLRFLYF